MWGYVWPKAWGCVPMLAPGESLLQVLVGMVCHPIITIVLFLYIFSLIFGITNAPGMPPGHNTLPWWVSSWAFMELGDRVQPEWESEQSVQPVHPGILYCRQRLDHWHVWNQLHHKSSQKCNGGGRTVAVGFTLLFPLATSFILTL